MAVTIVGDNTPTAGGVGYGTGANLAFTTAGTSGQVLTSAGAGAPTWAGINVSTGVTGVLPVANGGTNSTATPTAGGVGYGTGTAHAYTAAGTSGQVLTSAGAGAPTWTTPSAGAMTLIATRTASSSASLEWTGLSGYSIYMLIINNLIPDTNSVTLFMQFGTGAGPTYETSNYDTAWQYSTSSQSVNAAQFHIAGYGNTITSNSQGAWGSIFLNRMSGGGYPGVVGTTSGSSFTTGNQNPRAWTGQAGASTTAKTAIKLFYSSGNISSGTASLYGISN